MEKITITNKLKNNHEEKICIKRYASGEFIIKTSVDYHNRIDTSYINQDILKAIRELEMRARMKKIKLNSQIKPKTK